MVNGCDSMKFYAICNKMKIRSLPVIVALATCLGLPALAHASSSALTTILSDWHTRLTILKKIWDNPVRGVNQQDAQFLYIGDLCRRGLTFHV